jgi:hypothetical protein
MTKQQLERQIAKITGEDLCTIKQYGFSIESDGLELLDDCDIPIDWDQLDRNRFARIS